MPLKTRISPSADNRTKHMHRKTNNCLVLSGLATACLMQNKQTNLLVIGFSPAFVAAPRTLLQPQHLPARSCWHKNHIIPPNGHTTQQLLSSPSPILNL